MLLLPLAAAVFDDAASKRLVLKTVVVTCLAGALVSFMAVTVVALPGWAGRGVVFRNYATQGIVFSLAIIICGAALMRAEAFAGDRLLGDRRIMAAAIVALLVDVVFVLTGRSGYVSVIVMGAVIVVLLATGSWRAKALAGLGVLVCIGIVLASSAHVRSRVSQAVREIASVDQVAEGTSLGQRVVMWRNTVRMIRDHPIIGVGTGGFQDGYRPYVQDMSGWQGNETGDPHNQFLKIQGEQGLIGLAALLFFIFRVLTCPAPPPYRELAVAALVGWCATSLASSHFSTFAEGRLLFFWIGAMLADQADLNGAKLRA
jgi:O-antigen ligase